MGSFSWTTRGVPLGKKVRVISPPIRCAMTDDSYLTELAACYVRGHTGLEGEDQAMVELGYERGLKMYRFKRSELPRVTKCIGLLKGLGPSTLLDVGTGRGVFLWTMLTDIPYVDATCIDILDTVGVDLLGRFDLGEVHIALLRERVQHFEAFGIVGDLLHRTIVRLKVKVQVQIIRNGILEVGEAHAALDVVGP